MAEGDFETMRRESRVRRRPNWAAVCFHAQQCAEKYLKALLQAAAVEFPRTHDLVALLDLRQPPVPDLARHRDDLALLSAHAVACRYPGDSTERTDARECRARCERFRTTARRLLGCEAAFL
jgi:HEPN domain-containing protein